MTYAEAIKEIEDALLYNGVQNPLTDRAIEKIKELIEGTNNDARRVLVSGWIHSSVRDRGFKARGKDLRRNL